jgi:hypothetical protein
MRMIPQYPFREEGNTVMPALFREANGSASDSPSRLEKK